MSYNVRVCGACADKLAVVGLGVCVGCAIKPQHCTLFKEMDQ